MEDNTTVYLQVYQSLKCTNLGFDLRLFSHFIKKNKQPLKDNFHFLPWFLKSSQGSKLLDRF